MPSLPFATYAAITPPPSVNTSVTDLIKGLPGLETGGVPGLEGGIPGIENLEGVSGLIGEMDLSALEGFLDAIELPSQATPVGIPFGGMITGFLPFCTRPFGASLLFVSPPRAGDYLYVPGVSVLFANFKPFPGSWTVGNFVPGGVCVIGFCPFCVVIPATGVITMFGTS